MPSGASTGIHEALELRDEDKGYMGKSVLKAVANVNDVIGPALVKANIDVTNQKVRSHFSFVSLPPFLRLFFVRMHCSSSCTFQLVAAAPRLTLARSTFSCARGLPALRCRDHRSLTPRASPSLRIQAADDLMLKLDGTPNKGKLGANAILGVSMAITKAGAAQKGVPLYKHIADLAGKTNEPIMPVPCFNVINGGSHAGNKLAMQEFMIAPTGAASFTEGVCPRAPASSAALADRTCDPFSPDFSMAQAPFSCVSAPRFVHRTSVSFLFPRVPSEPVSAPQFLRRDIFLRARAVCATWSHTRCMLTPCAPLPPLHNSHEDGL